MIKLKDRWILIVDDSKPTLELMRLNLKRSGFNHLAMASSAAEAFERLSERTMGDGTCDFDLILLDIVMDEMDGIEVCKQIKSDEKYKNIPVVMITARTDDESLDEAFEAGAIDYLTKPVNNTELSARARSALRLKMEMDERQDRETRLEKANKELERLSSLDGLTGVANRRYFDKALDLECRRAVRESKPISLAMVDVDHFKPFNDHYGHLAGDDCLKKIVKVIQSQLKRPGDFLARYGGEEFSIVLPDTSNESALQLIEGVRAAVESMKIIHEAHPVSSPGCVTVSAGIATITPTVGISPASLIEKADSALYTAKHEGRNLVVNSSC